MNTIIYLNQWLQYQLFTSMRTALVSMAEEVVRGDPNGIEINERFKNTINQISNLGESLQALSLSDTYIFVYATNMIKLIESGEFCIITETRSEENIVNMTETPSQKSKIYGQIMMTLSFHLQSKERPHYITQSMIDLVAISLKNLFEDNNNQIYLETIFSNFIPHYKLDDRLINNPCDSIITPIEMRRNIDFTNLNNYCLLVRIFISMYEYITVHNGVKRNIYIFRNSYLGYFLQFGVQHIKALFATSSNQHLHQVIVLTLQLLQSVFMYPFTLSLHEFELDDEAGENITGAISGDIYLPNFFRHVICDENFLTIVMQYYHYLLDRTNSFQDSRNEIGSIIKILGRSICSNQYTFKNEEEKSFSRNFSQNMVDDICLNFKFYDSYYLNAILDIIQKHLTMYDSILIEIKRLILFKAINFFKLMIAHSDINIFQGRRNPFARAFEIVVLVMDYAKDKLVENELNSFKEECQVMLELAFNRITSTEMNSIIERYGFNQPTQIESFTELYESLIPIFEANLERNLGLFEQLDLRLLQPGAKVMWLHLCSQLLPKTQANMRQTVIILKYYELASKGDSLASLCYIKILTEQILKQCSEGVSTTQLWRNIEQISRISFQDFMMNTINICIFNFSNGSSEIIDYSLQFFKSIYVNLRKHDTKAFQAYYSVVKDLLSAIHTSIFVNPIYFPKRRTFFNVISLIWMNGEAVEYIYEIHRMISMNINEGNTSSFCQYLHDITGIIESIDRHESFEVIAELALIDLKSLFTIHFKDDNSINCYFNDPFFMKIFCRLVIALISDINRKLYFETHTDIPLKIHELFYPLVAKLVTPLRDIPYQLSNILQKFVVLNPLAPLISLEPIIKIMKEQSCQGLDRLVRAYFENLQRVDNIGWMYDLIEQNIDYMVLWWEEVIFRDIKPNINLRVIAESRIWGTQRQKETLAKLIFQIGYYDGSYWSVAEFRSEREFVNKFCELYD